MRGFAFLFAVSAATSCFAHDPHSHQVNEKVSDARNKMGGMCCNGQDYDLADAWERTDKGFRVFVKGEWLDVPPGAYVDNIRNPYTEAIVWLYPTRGAGKRFAIRCFKEGLTI